MLNTYYSHRKHLILNIVNYLGPISRTKLISLTDYRPATVGELTKELLEEKLLVETGFYSSGHGRKRALLTINNEHLCAIGIAFSSTSVVYTVTQFDGGILCRKETVFSPSMPKEELASQIIRQTSLLIEDNLHRLIVGIGISAPLYGPGYYMEGTSSYEQFIHWLLEGLTPSMQQAFPYPVRTFSAVTLPALVEQRFGRAKGIDNFFCVELSNGIGCSICCNGRVVAGSSGVAGEMGHTVIDASETGGKLCYCGKPGCVERTTAFPALSEEILSALKQGVHSVLNTFYDPSLPLTVQDIRRALDEEDKLCRHCVKRAAQRIGIAIANTVNLLNPEMVVLYGFMLELGDYFVSNLCDSIRENVITMAQRFQIQISASLENTLPLGAAAEMFSDYLRIEEFKWVYHLQPSELDCESGHEDPTA